MAKKPRNDSFIYSGITSATNERREAAKEIREEKKQKKVADRGKLLPAADIVFDEVARQKQKVFEELAKLPLPASIKEGRVLARLEAIQMQLKFLEDFNVSMQNKLRSRPIAQENISTEESDDE